MYTGFAYVYDKLMMDINYIKWANYIETIFSIQKVNPSIVLDMGCGTGSLSIEFAKRGYEMIGVDLSQDMLSCAKQKAINENLDILFLHQNMTKLDLYGTVDAVLSMVDSMNYLRSKTEMKAVLKKVHNYLNPGGIFIFDFNTIYKLKNVLGSNVFYEVGYDISYIWQNDYNKNNNTTTFDLTFFIRNGELHEKHEEIHVQKSYTKKDLKEMIVSSGLLLEGVYDEFSFRPTHSRSKRVFFICRKGE